MICQICSNELNSVFDLYDDRYGYPGKFPLMKCKFCGHKQLQIELTSEIIKTLYTKHYPRSKFDIEKYKPDVEVRGGKSWFNGLYSSAFRWVPQNVRVLDIGCGFGEALGYHKARGCEVYGVEADENTRRVADIYGFNIKIGLFEPNDYQKEYFDYVTVNQVIEHVNNPLEFLKGIASVLKPQGKLVISTPNSNGWGARVFGKKWINWHAPYHLQFYSKKSMKLALAKSGFSIGVFKTVTNSEWLNYQWVHLLTYPKMGQTSDFWSLEQKAFKGSKRVLLKFLSLIHKLRINHITTRFFDLLGIGDNYIIVVRKN